MTKKTWIQKFNQINLFGLNPPRNAREHRQKREKYTHPYTLRSRDFKLYPQRQTKKRTHQTQRDIINAANTGLIIGASG